MYESLKAIPSSHRSPLYPCRAFRYLLYPGICILEGWGEPMGPSLWQIAMKACTCCSSFYASKPLTPRPSILLLKLENLACSGPCLLSPLTSKKKTRSLPRKRLLVFSCRLYVLASTVEVKTLHNTLSLPGLGTPDRYHHDSNPQP